MQQSNHKGWIAWFAHNPVAANLLMICIFVAGIYTAMNIRTEGFPGFEANQVTISVEYKSGAAQETERGVTEKIERALTGTEGIKKVTSTSTASNSSIVIEKSSGTDLDKLLSDIKTKVDAVSLPSTAEKPVVVRAEEIEDAIQIELYGEADPDVLDTVARRIKDRLLEDALIPTVTISGERMQEISIEVQEEALQRYKLSFDELVRQVGNFSLISQQGSLKSENGRILIKADRQGYFLQDFESIPVVTLSDGTVVRLQDVAKITDAYTDDRSIYRYQGLPARKLSVQLIGKANLIPAAVRAREIINEVEAEDSLPTNIKFDFWEDESENISDRLSLMMKNGLMGMGLVLVTLALFLNLRTAFWVAMGLPIAFAGALTLMGDSFWGMTLNEMTTFGFIIALGIVVDDAIVVAESAHSVTEKEGDGIDNVIKGVKLVATPAIFGVLTTIAAFYPITLVTGRLAEVFSVFSWVVVFCLVFSIIESKFILPAHLAHLKHNAKPANPLSRGWKVIQNAVSGGLERFKQSVYRPLVKLSLRMRYLSALCFVVLFVAVVYMVPSGIVRVVFFPEIPRQIVTATYKGEPDLGYGRLFAEANRIEAAAHELKAQLDAEVTSGVSPITGIEMQASDDGNVTVLAITTPPSERDITANEIAERWRKLVGPVEGAQTIKFAADDFDFADFRVELLLDDVDQLIAASQYVEDRLSTQNGVLSVTNDFRAVRGRLNIELTDYGRSVGMTTSAISEQVFQAIGGAEIQEFQRNQQEVKVRVRYPEAQRSSAAALQTLYVRTPAGDPILLSSVANLHSDLTVDEIYRSSRKRVATLDAQINKDEIAADALVTYFNQEILPELQAMYPGVAVDFGGEVEQQREAIGGLMTAFGITIIAIYVLLAVPLKSYTQPIVVMIAIPFGITGAIIGHWIVGIPVSILSINGILALSGIVVNDSLLLVSAFNDNRAVGMPMRQALVAAGTQRMRAVILTSTTTFAGLAPMIFETAEQAQFLIPAAVSLGFGILFATLITLFLIPTFMMILADVRRLKETVIGLVAPKRMETDAREVTVVGE
ncbi:Swarming motility protein SwrC [Pseudovibrio sp. Ad46]|uniref:efflux RND transporter permease subunit n=1 Tax=unclassified Pseudovibrio TaxID=2627060 RepID=UPI0007AE8E54|nr:MULTISPECIES: efflux RND transporter permease subunit [unclassified Pseudovibrio]KZK77213.1 Swarming motility protein SwrC [Pseudovibrio sp. Ad46]KZK89707.1 Swarming motility protein SwrC [Pseudovibrio sp. Ad5]